MIVLRGRERYEDLEQYFTDKEVDLAVAIGRAWLVRGLKPSLLCKSWDGRFSWLTSQLSQREAA